MMNKTGIFICLFCCVSILALSQDSSSQIISVKMQAIEEELKLDEVKIKPVGSSDDLMLEGTVSSEAVSNRAKEVTNLYFSNVFNLLSVEKPQVRFQFKVIKYLKLKNTPSASRSTEVLKEGMDMEKPWYFLLFDNMEMESLVNEVKNLFSGEVLECQKPVKSASNQIRIPFTDNGKNYEAFLTSTYLDNGFFNHSLKIEMTGPDTEGKVIFNMPLYSKSGEWIVVTGFSLAEEPVNVPEEYLTLFVFQPTLQKRNNLES
ncbi:MAG: hypothetical protein JW774_01430 [Candidatus Aureabacteria bacterium]|nr:hypothetical protein [Candidatus Auribacterota bacterium]